MLKKWRINLFNYLFLVIRLGDGRIYVNHGVVVPLLDVEGEVAAGHNVNNLLNSNIFHLIDFGLFVVSLNPEV